MSELGSICIECFSLVQCDHGTKVRCKENKFKDRLPQNHPFVTLPRACKFFDNDPEVTDDKKRDKQPGSPGVQTLPETLPV